MFGTLGDGTGFSGGFGAVAGSGLSSFANPGGAGQIVGLQGGSTKFGAAAGDEEEEEGDDEDDEKSEVRSPKPDPERRVVGKGEEDDETEFQARAKLFVFTSAIDDKKKIEWKERGLGTLKFNVNYAAKKARLILRNDSTGRMVLNSPIQVNLDFGNRDAKPTNGLVLFQGCLAREAPAEGELVSKDGPPVEMLQLKVSNPQSSRFCEVHVLTCQLQLKQENAFDLWDRVQKVKKRIKEDTWEETA